MENTNTPNTHDGYRLVAVLNKRVETGKTMNALAHCVAGAINLIGDDGRQALKFIDFADRDAQAFPTISARSFIVLRGSDSELRKVRQQGIESGLPVVVFTDTMTGGTYEDQLRRTKETPTAALSFYCVVLVGHTEQIGPITRKLSLWRDVTAPISGAARESIPEGYVAEEKA